MRVVLFTGTFFPLFNGVISYTLDVATELSKKGHEVVWIAPKSKSSYRFRASKYPFKVVFARSVPVPIYPDFRLTLPALPQIIATLKSFNPDIVHTNDPTPLSTEGIIAAKILHIPKVITFHTFVMDRDMLKVISQRNIVSLLGKPISVLNAKYHNLADMVICPSHEAQDELVRHGLTRPRRVIANGVDLSLVKPLDAVYRFFLRKTYGIEKKQPVAIYVGRLSQDKSVSVLLDTWVEVHQELPSAWLVIVGGGPMEESLRQIAKEKNIAHSVVFTGSMPREEIFKKGIYSLGDVFVSASTIENQSMAMIEAMASGLPIVGVKKRGTQEIINETNGVLVSARRPRMLGQALIKMLTDDSLRHKLSMGALKQSKAYDIQKTTDELVSVYQMLIENKT